MTLSTRLRALLEGEGELLPDEAREGCIRILERWDYRFTGADTILAELVEAFTRT